MNKKEKLIIILGIIVFSLILSYFLVNFYNHKHYINQLPSVPDLNDVEVSMQNYISEANSKVHDEPSSENLGVLGMVYHANNYVEEAEKCYQLAIKRAPKNWKWSYYLGCLKRELGDSEKSIENFNVVLDSNPKVYMALYYLGEAHQQFGSATNAEEIFKKLSNLNDRMFEHANSKRNTYFPLPVYASLQLAKLYINSNKNDIAEKQLKELINKQITFGPAYRQLSILYAKEGDEKLSNYYSERSNDLNIYSSPVDTLLDKLSFYSRSEMYLLKQIDDAIRSSNSLWALELVTHGLKNVPESKYITSKAIKQFVNMNAVNRALPYIDEHIKSFENNYKELIEVGTLFANVGYKSQAEKYFQNAEKVENGKIDAKSTLAGMYYEKLGMKDKALSMMHELLEKYPENEDVLSDATFLYLNLGEIERANKYLARLTKVAPSNPDINVFNGIISQNKGDLPRSIGYFEQALIANPENKFIINHLADYYQKNNLWLQAINFYKTALKQYPNDSNVQEAYGALLLNCSDKSLRNIEQAREYSERAFINKVYTLPTRISAGKSLAIAYFQLEEQGKALYYMNSTIEIAKRARASNEYIANLENILSDFQGIINSK
jgi:tetratricopeptide (TPR) repeat protein